MVHFDRAMLPILSRLNTKFGIDGIYDVVANRKNFVGKPFNDAMAQLVSPPGTDLYNVFMGFLMALPQSFHGTLVSLVGHALNSDPPVLINFAWAPGYDYEMTQWFVPEPKPELSGITLLLKTRYPEDPHPLTSAQAVSS